MTDPETIRAVIDRHLATLRTMIAEIEAIRAQLLGETSLVVQEGQGGALALPGLSTIGRKAPVPTKLYATVWDRCRDMIDLGPVEEWGPLFKSFQKLHRTCLGNTRWAAFCIIRFFHDDDAVMAGVRQDWFHKAIDRLALEVKHEMRNEVRVGPVGLPAEEPASPQDVSKLIADLFQNWGKK